MKCCMSTLLFMQAKRKVGRYEEDLVSVLVPLWNIKKAEETPVLRNQTLLKNYLNEENIYISLEDCITTFALYLDVPNRKVYSSSTIIQYSCKLDHSK